MLYIHTSIHMDNEPWKEERVVSFLLCTGLHLFALEESITWRVPAQKGAELSGTNCVYRAGERTRRGSNTICKSDS